LLNYGYTNEDAADFSRAADKLEKYNYIERIDL
jgi:hypothetical protein